MRISAMSMFSPIFREKVFSKLSALANSAPRDFRTATYRVIRSFSFIAVLPHRSRPPAAGPPSPLWRTHAWYPLFCARDDRRSLSARGPPPEAGSYRHAVKSAAHNAGAKLRERVDDHSPDHRECRG